MAIFYQSRSPPALLHRSVFFYEQHTGGSTLHGGRKHGGGKLITQWGILFNLIKFNKQECSQGNLVLMNCENKSSLQIKTRYLYEDYT